MWLRKGNEGSPAVETLLRAFCTLTLGGGRAARAISLCLSVPGHSRWEPTPHRAALTVNSLRQTPR